MKYDTIYSLGSRCQNSLILKEFNLREFSGFFDFLNVEKVNTLIHILENDFKEFFKNENIFTFDFNQLTINPETGEYLRNSIRTSNKFYQPEDYLDPHAAICPHYNLNDENEKNHLIRCYNRFKKLNTFKVLFNYTYNSWENSVKEQDIIKIINILKEFYYFDNFKICFVSLVKSDSSGFKIIEQTNLYDIWELSILKNSYTGGLFSNSIDNQNFINIINHYPLSENRLTKKQIDQIE